MSLHKRTTGRMVRQAHHPEQGRRKGFTLIELLVVIAIIAILAAILFPVFAKARDKARTTACLSNMKQIALAVQMYIGDWDGFFPFASYGYGVWPSPPPDIESALLPYVENNYALFRCPTDIKARAGGYHACTYGFRYVQDTRVYGAYGLNLPPSEFRPSANLDDLHAPANFIIVTEIADDYLTTGTTGRATVEGAEYVSHGASTLGLVSGDYPANPYIVTVTAFRHAGGEIGNMAFADGHAKGVSSKLPCTAVTGIECMELDDMYTWLMDGP